jgi:hypothetical protein
MIINLAAKLYYPWILSSLEQWLACWAEWLSHNPSIIYHSYQACTQGPWPMNNPLSMISCKLGGSVSIWFSRMCLRLPTNCSSLCTFLSWTQNLSSQFCIIPYMQCRNQDPHHVSAFCSAHLLL